MRIRTILCALLACLLFGLVAVPATASEEDEDAEADPTQDPAVAKLYTEGQDLFQAGAYVEALAKFKEVLARSGSPNARLYVARCLKQLGRLGEAYAEMERTVREAAARAPTEPKYGPTRNAAAAQLATLEMLVGKLVIAIDTPPPGMTITLNGETVDPLQYGQPIPLETGEINIIATATDKPTIHKKTAIVAGKTTTVTITFPATVGGGDGDTEETPDEDVETTGGGVRIGGYVVTGVGVVSLVVFGVTAGMAQGKLNDLEDCQNTGCTDAEKADMVDSGETLQTVANITLVAGITCVVGGLGMIIFGGPTEVPKNQNAWVDVSPGGGMLNYWMRF